MVFQKLAARAEVREAEAGMRPSEKQVEQLDRHLLVLETRDNVFKCVAEWAVPQVMAEPGELYT